MVITRNTGFLRGFLRNYLGGVVVVLTCDVCGAPIDGEPVIVEIDGAVLTVLGKVLNLGLH